MARGKRAIPHVEAERVRPLPPLTDVHQSWLGDSSDDRRTSGCGQAMLFTRSISALSTSPRHNRSTSDMLTRSTSRSSESARPASRSACVAAASLCEGRVDADDKDLDPSVATDQLTTALLTSLPCAAPTQLRVNRRVLRGATRRSRRVISSITLLHFASSSVPSPAHRAHGRSVITRLSPVPASRR